MKRTRLSRVITKNTSLSVVLDTHLAFHSLMQLHGLLERLDAALEVHLIADLALVLHDLLTRLRQDLLHLLFVCLFQRLDGCLMLVVLGVERIDYLGETKGAREM